jgi:hypothetical protein
VILLAPQLLDLELDCVHEIPGHGTWLKVPLGKLDTERMIPLDEETVELIDQITQIRSTAGPLPHPRTRRPAQFLFTRHGHRLSQNAMPGRTRPRRHRCRTRPHHPAPTAPHLRYLYCLRPCAVRGFGGVTRRCRTNIRYFKARQLRSAR